MRRPPAPPAPSPAWAFFLDLDGTLVRIARTPQAVRIDPELRRVIRGLYRTSGGAVALISGRALADLDRLFRGVRIPAAGQHGAERRKASGRVVVYHDTTPRFEAARRRLADVAARHEGLLLEDKGLSLALHYRRSPALGGYVRRVVNDQAARLGKGWCVQTGKRVVEIRPAGRDKGRAVRDFMREPPFRGRTPVMLGDDVTDEYAFAVVNRLGGLSVKVGNGSTRARWRLRDVAAVRRWLHRGEGG